MHISIYLFTFMRAVMLSESKLFDENTSFGKDDVKKLIE